MQIELSDCISRIMGVTVIITGGAGFIGSHLVDFLLEHGAGQVIVIDDLTRPRMDWIKEKKEDDRV